jgi:hypothetical protein
MMWRNLTSGDDLETRTMIVCGIERGGTSMVAGVLHHLGVSMGETLDATYEDHDLAIKVRDYIATRSESSSYNLQNAIMERNTQYPTWGFKIPNIFMEHHIFDLFLNTTLIFVFRDPVAIAEHIAKISKPSPDDIFESVSYLYSKLTDLYRRTTRPAIAISYEKAVVDPRGFLQDFVGLLRVPVSQDTLKSAEDVIQRSPKDYVAIAGPVEIVGHVEGFVCGDLVGWALDTGDEMRIIVLELSIDGQMEQRIEASGFREDLWTYCENNLNHGFTWRIPARYYDGYTHQVDIRANGSDSTRIANTSVSLKFPAIFGALEEFTDGYVRGWVHSFQHPISTDDAVITIDNNITVPASRDLVRTDLEDWGVDKVRGLMFKIPQTLLDGHVHRVHLTVNGAADLHIAGSPKSLRLSRPKEPDVETSRISID